MSVDVVSKDDLLYSELWGMGEGAGIEVYFHPEPIPDEDPSDRIRLRIRQTGGNWRGWLMNTEDAVAIIRGLIKGVAACIEAGVPAKAAEPVSGGAE